MLQTLSIIYAKQLFLRELEEANANFSTLHDAFVKQQSRMKEYRDSLKAATYSNSLLAEKVEELTAQIDKNQVIIITYLLYSGIKLYTYDRMKATHLNCLAGGVIVLLAE